MTNNSTLIKKLRNTITGKKLLVFCASILFAATALMTGFSLNETTCHAGAGKLFQHIQLNPSDLTEEEIFGLQYMREEEKVARDVYVYFYSLWNLPTFNNISASEQVHMNAVLMLLDRYGIDDPAAGNDYGEFTNPDLQDLFDLLTEYGATSLIDSLYVGALIEEVDILDLIHHIEETTHEDIRTVFSRLEWASGNHLRAFVRQLAFRGIEYEPVLLDRELYDSIINR